MASIISPIEKYFPHMGCKQYIAAHGKGGAARLNRNFRFQLYLCAKPYVSHPLVSISGHGGQLIGKCGMFVWFSPPASFGADTCPHRMSSERSTCCLSQCAIQMNYGC